MKEEEEETHTAIMIMGEVPIILVSLTSTSDICRICSKSRPKLITSLHIKNIIQHDIQNQIILTDTCNLTFKKAMIIYNHIWLYQVTVFLLIFFFTTNSRKLHTTVLKDNHLTKIHIIGHQHIQHLTLSYLVIEKYTMAMISSTLCFAPVNNFRTTILLQSFNISLHV